MRPTVGQTGKGCVVFYYSPLLRSFERPNEEGRLSNVSSAIRLGGKGRLDKKGPLPLSESGSQVGLVVCFRRILEQSMDPLQFQAVTLDV